jgi:histidyl-tRNA synthetase
MNFTLNRRRYFMEIQAPKGTKDMLPQDAYKWHYVEGVLRDVSKSYGVREIRTPMFEHTELFLRGVGETTDIVQKEMYTFNDKGDRSITLKPEGTAPTVRAFIENRLFNEAQPTKLYYIIPCFRYENVQKGRLRQFHQYGVEVFGSKEASIDAEVISLAMESLKKLGLKSLSLNINNLGCPKCRPKYNEALKRYLEENYDNLCGICKTRFEKNPMRILDCKEKSCNEITKHAPIILDYICEECDSHFTEVKNYLDALKIQYKVDPGIVRGLDYYTKTIFEILNDDFTVCGGGRYDKLIEEIGGPEMPAVGFGLGLERLIMTLEKEGIEIPNEGLVDLYIGARGETAKTSAFVLANKLRAVGIKTEINHMGRSIKAEMKYANKIGSAFTTILGDDELQNKTLKLKRMSDGEQFEVSLDNIEEIAKLVK